MELDCEIVTFGSDRYAETVALRNQLLREPLGLTFTETEKADEPHSIHLAALEGARVVACVVLTPLAAAGLLRLRQFAVAADRQRQGIGTALCRFSEAVARERGYTRITMHARLVAAPFYERHGYHRVGEVYTEIGIPHVTMQKTL